MYRRYYRDDIELTTEANEAILDAINSTQGGGQVNVDASIEPFNPDIPIDKEDIKSFINDSDDNIIYSCVNFHFEPVNYYLDYYQSEALIDDYNELKSLVANNIREALKKLL